MKLNVTAPGRICLFGEHQDYLGLPVIATAIDVKLEIALTTDSAPPRRYRLLLHDLDREETIDMEQPITYRHERDYLRSAVKILQSEGVCLPKALTATVSSRIPIAAGTSSSSALCVAWCGALLEAAGRAEAKDPAYVTRLAHRAEVIEFNESGGMMDQATIAHGGLIHFQAGASPELIRIAARPQGFVLGDSMQPKDTQAILSRVRGTMERTLARFEERGFSFSLASGSLDEARAALQRIAVTGEEADVLFGNVVNRDLLREARQLLEAGDPEPARLGELLARHHAELSGRLRISTPKIEAMVAAAVNAGALGAKINGSGGGGCMFAYAPGRTAEVATAIEEAGGRAYRVEISQGLCYEIVE